MSNRCYCNLRQFLQLVLWASTVPLILVVKILISIKELWSCLNYALVFYSLSSDAVLFLCCWVTKRTFESWHPSILSLNSIFVRLILIWSSLVPALILSVEMLFTYACFEEFFRSLSWGAWVLWHLIVIVVVLIQSKELAARHNWVVVHIVKILLWILSLRPVILVRRTVSPPFLPWGFSIALEVRIFWYIRGLHHRVLSHVLYRKINLFYH